jgi:hypothetical protein
MARHDPEDLTRPTRIKGRGAGSNREGRFEALTKTLEDDGWYREEEGTPRPPTRVSIESARSIISRNESPDIPFKQSINPYRGCEHGCNYCYARPSHSYLNLSPGLDFETQLFAKTNAAGRRRAAIAKEDHAFDGYAAGESDEEPSRWTLNGQPGTGRRRVAVLDGQVPYRDSAAALPVDAHDLATAGAAQYGQTRLVDALSAAEGVSAFDRERAALVARVGEGNRAGRRRVAADDDSDRVSFVVRPGNRERLLYRRGRSGAEHRGDCVARREEKDEQAGHPCSNAHVPLPVQRCHSKRSNASAKMRSLFS